MKTHRQPLAWIPMVLVTVGLCTACSKSDEADKRAATVTAAQAPEKREAPPSAATTRRGNAKATSFVKLRKRFAKKDANDDGKLSRAEALAGVSADKTATVGQRFEAQDANSDGHVTLEEAIAHRERAGARRSAKKGAKPASTTAKGQAWRRKQFAQQDKNGDGQLVERELLASVAPEDVLSTRLQFASMDANSDGKVTLEEALQGHKRARKRRAGRKAAAPEGKKRLDPAARFAKRDADGNNGLSLTEWVNSKDAAARKRQAVKFKLLDADGDGAISLTEFEQMFRGRKAP